MSLDQIETLREQIDELDRSILAILEARLALSRGLGALKRSQNTPLRDQSREQEVLQHLLTQSQDEDLKYHLPKIYASISACCLYAQLYDDENSELDEYASVLEDEYEVIEEEVDDHVDAVNEIEVPHTMITQVDVESITFDQRKESSFRISSLIRFRRRKKQDTKKEKHGVLSTSQKEMVLQAPFAHRGFHTAEIPENSCLAFETALHHGYGIELDVHLTADHIPVVFHDESLLRMTGIDEAIASKTWNELQELRLSDSQEMIPSLAQVLDLVAGQVPLLIEIKNHRNPVGPLEGAVAHLLDAYSGEFCIQSFNPMVLKWFLKHRPHFVRGLLSYAYPADEVQLSASTRFLLRNLLLSPLCKPHYIAYDYQDLNRFKLRHLHRMRAKGIPLLVWTVRSQAAEQLVRLQSDNFIFENFHPQAMTPPLLNHKLED